MAMRMRIASEDFGGPRQKKMKQQQTRRRRAGGQAGEQENYNFLAICFCATQHVLLS